MAAPAQVLLRWATQRGIAVIPKSNDPERVKLNLRCDDFNLSEEEINRFNSLNIGLRVSLVPLQKNKNLGELIFNQLNDPADIDPRLAIFA